MIYSNIRCRAFSCPVRQVKGAVASEQGGKCEKRQCEGVFNNSDGKQVGFRWQGLALNATLN